MLCFLWFTCFGLTALIPIRTTCRSGQKPTLNESAMPSHAKSMYARTNGLETILPIEDASLCRDTWMAGRLSACATKSSCPKFLGSRQRQRLGFHRLRKHNFLPTRRLSGWTWGFLCFAHSPNGNAILDFVKVNRCRWMPSFDDVRL